MGTELPSFKFCTWVRVKHKHTGTVTEQRSRAAATKHTVSRFNMKIILGTNWLPLKIQENYLTIQFWLRNLRNVISQLCCRNNMLITHWTSIKRLTDLTDLTNLIVDIYHNRCSTQQTFKAPGIHHTRFSTQQTFATQDIHHTRPSPQHMVSGVVNILCGEFLVWWMSYWTHGLVNVLFYPWCGECSFLHILLWISVWWMSYYPCNPCNTCYYVIHVIDRPDPLNRPNQPDPSWPDWFMLKLWNRITEWVNQPVEIIANQKKNHVFSSSDIFFCTFPEGGKSIFRPFYRQKGRKGGGK